MVKFRVKVDYRRAQKKLLDAQKKIFIAGTASVQDLANMGMRYAKVRAPYFTGRTARLIKTFRGKDNRGPYAEVVSQNSTKGGVNRSGGGKYGGNFNLVRWMHATNGVKRDSTGRFSGKHIKSGDPRYMWTTEKYLRRVKVDVARKNFNKLRLNK